MKNRNIETMIDTEMSVVMESMEGACGHRPLWQPIQKSLLKHMNQMRQLALYGNRSVGSSNTAVTAPTVPSHVTLVTGRN